MLDDDRDLLLSWAGGDRDAGSALIERHFDSLDRFFASKAGDRRDDLVQQTFLRCAEAAPTYRGESSARAFLFGVARNVLCEHIRSRVRDGKVPADFDDRSIADLVPGVTTLVSKNAEQRQLILALQQLPLELQIAAELYYWEELSIDELAVATGVPPGTVKSRLHRARTLIREAMERAPQNDDPRGARTLLGQWLLKLRELAPVDEAG